MPAPKIRDFRVTSNTVLATDCFLLTFEPADGEPMFTFTAGQWVMVYLPPLVAGEKPWRGAFSIASSPSDSKTSFELAVKIYGDFTKRLQKLAVGDIVQIHGAFGIFTLRPNADHLVMFAAGIGITPFRSMVRELAEGNDLRDIHVIYSNRSVDGTSFEEEFRALQAAHPNIHTTFILTKDPPQGWTGETGRFDAEKCTRLIPDISNREFLMCGSPEFMQTIAELLAARGLDTKAKLRKELFG